MQKQQLQNVLGRLAFAENLPDEVVAALAGVSVLQEFPAGHVVFSEGSHCGLLYLIVDGRVALDMQVPGRGVIRVLSLGSGDMLGWSALLSNGRMTATARMVDDTAMIAAHAADLLQLCERNPAFGYLLMRQMAVAISKRLVATRLQLLDVFAAPGHGG